MTEEQLLKAVGLTALLETELLRQVDAIGTSRELSLAKTKMEEASLWISKHVTKVTP